MEKEYTKVVIQHDEDGDRYFECPKCGCINWLAPVDEPGIEVDCEICEKTFLLKE